VIVADASAIVSGLLRRGPARANITSEALHVPHLIDTEVVDAIRKLVLRDHLEAADAERALAVWQRFGVRRHPTVRLIDRIWELRHNVSAYDAAYIALAETLQCNLLTSDHRLASATGPRCAIEVVPR